MVLATPHPGHLRSGSPEAGDLSGKAQLSTAQRPSSRRPKFVQPLGQPRKQRFFRFRQTAEEFSLHRVLHSATSTKTLACVVRRLGAGPRTGASPATRAKRRISSANFCRVGHPSALLYRSSVMVPNARRSISIAKVGPSTPLLHGRYIAPNLGGHSRCWKGSASTL